MSVYIKDMDMPTSCFQCKLLDFTNNFVCRHRFKSLAGEHGINISRPDWCPLVPVSDHGDLIDVDKALNALPENYEKSDLENIIATAPTIIPADKEGEG